MNAFEKAKLKRKLLRTSTSKLINKLNDIIANSQTNEEIKYTLSEIFDQLEEKDKGLTVLNSEIENNINDPDEYEDEISVNEEYHEKIVSAKCSIKYHLKTLDTASETKVEAVSTNISNESSATPFDRSSTAVKLPKLSIKPFSGDSSLWLEFYNTFETSINQNQSLSKVEKLIYLKSLLTNDPYNIAQSFPLNAESYDSCIALLKDRYGDIKTIINSHMNKLLSIEPVKHASNIKGLKQLFDKIDINIRSLNSLGVTSDSYGHLLNPILMKLLPHEIVIEFYRKGGDKNKGDVSELVNFVKTEIQCREAALLAAGPSQTKNYEHNMYRNNNKSHWRNNIPSAAALTSTTDKFCIFCNKVSDHVSYQCKQLSDEEKRKILRKGGRCYRCFSRQHISLNCKSKIKPCTICKGQNHSSLFCKQTNSSNDAEPGPSETRETVVSMTKYHPLCEQKTTILQTCSVDMSYGTRCENIRLLADAGSERTFVLRDVVRKLNLPVVRRERLLIYGFRQRSAQEEIYNVVEFTIRGRIYPREELKIRALVVDTICSAKIKAYTADVQEKISRAGINLSLLADAGGKDVEISILLGGDYFWKIQKGSPRKISNSLYISETIFGITVQGQIETKNVNETHSVNRISVQNIASDLKCFWELEHLGILQNQENKSDLNSIKQFEENIEFIEGRYQTKLLWKEGDFVLDNNYDVAKKRFLSLANKLKQNEHLFNECNKIIKNQLELGIVELCDNDSDEQNSYFMPFSLVVREDKSTTKVRIVYDASSKRNKDTLSLNDCLLSGVNRNPNVLDILLKFRKNKIGFSADLEAAFHQIKIVEEDRRFLKFLYFEDCDPNKSITSYQMTRVPFGTTCSTFLLLSTIKYHIKGYEQTHSEAVNMINTSVYTDDLFYTTETVKQAYELSIQAREILNECGMNLRKFNTNSKELKQNWIQNNIPIESETEFDNPAKVLGVVWNTHNDTLRIELKSLLLPINKLGSKRLVLQTAAKIFDPSGFLSPFVVRIKCMLQELWELGLDWDENFSNDLEKRWNSWYSELEYFTKLEIPRHYFPSLDNANEIQLHVFSDASPKSYGCVAYFRYYTNKGEFKTTFIMSKSRVSPLKKLSLPRLELMGALIGARMMKYLNELFALKQSTIMWTDSTIVLHWIKGSAKNWKPFVSNRISEIQEMTEPINWRHCDGKNNPADLLTRGCHANDLINSKKWWNGPEFLVLPESQWPVSKVKFDREKSDIAVEQKSISKIAVNVLETRNRESLFDLNRCGKLIRVFRITAWVLRFIHNCKKKELKTGCLTAGELREAEIFWIKQEQYLHFPEEVSHLSEGKQIPRTSCLFSFNPMLDEDGLLAVGGRLQSSKFEKNEKHPWILPTRSRYTELTILHSHWDVFHAGVAATLAQVREKYWILRGRQAVKSVLSKCLVCRKFAAKSGNQIMAPLPTDRITESPSFAVCAVDFAGPLYTKDSNNKHYILLITCAVTRAIHLEFVDNLSTETFLLAFRRFIARRGLCETIYSDNARTFKRANEDFKKLWACINDPQLQDFFSARGITWKYIVERAAWHGGFWERMVRTVKTALRKTIGKTSLSTDELNTVLIEIEATINSRPITFVYSDVDEPYPLTPAHFLIGRRLNSLPPMRLDINTFPNDKATYVKKHNYRERLLKQFWNRWKREYVLELRSANSVNTPLKTSKLEVGDVVLIEEQHAPRNMWRLGKVIKVFPGRDSKIRSCELKTCSGILRRPIQLLYPLEITN